MLTWNFRHNHQCGHAGADRRNVIEVGYEPPMICTPNELMEPDCADERD